MQIVNYENIGAEKSNLVSQFSKNYYFGKSLSIHCNESKISITHSESNQYYVVVIGKIYNIQNYKFDNTENVISDFILKNIDNNNESFFKDINGEFIIIILKKLDNSISIYRDQMGCMPFYYYKHKTRYIFSTHIKTLLNYINEPLEIDFRWLFNGLISIYNDNQITNYKNIFRLPAGHKMNIFEEKVSIIRYFNIKEIPIQKNEIADYYKSFKKLLIEAVEKRIISHNNIACELSGGLDSSTLTCISAQIKHKSNNKIHAFSHTLPDEALEKIFPFKDEREFSKLVADKYFNVSQSYIDLKEISLLELMRQIISELGYVPINNYVKYIIEPVRLSKNNSDIILSGFGGDELVSYQGFFYVRELIRKFRFGKAKKYFIQYCNHNKFNKIKGIVTLFANMYLHRLLNLNKKFFKQYSDTDLLNKEFIPLNINELIYQSEKIEPKNTLNSVLSKKISNHKFNLRIEASSEYSLINDINYVFPLLDIDLVQYYYSIPSNIKSSPLETRHFLRHSIKDIVPEKIRTRNDKSGSTIPSVQYSYLKDYEKITNFILHCRKNLKTHYINYDELLKWHSVLKYRKTGSTGKVKMALFITVLNFLVFQDMFENEEIK